MLYTLFLVLKGYAKHHFPVYLYLLKKNIAHNGAKQSHDFLEFRPFCDLLKINACVFEER